MYIKKEERKFVDKRIIIIIQAVLCRMESGEIDGLESTFVWKMPAESVKKKFSKIHGREKYFEKNVRESRDIINHAEGVKSCELRYTINMCLSTFLGASGTFIFIKIVH